MLVGCATLASLFPFVGTIVYAIIRPPEFLDEVRLRELEIQAAEARLTLVRLPAVPVLRLRGQGRVPALPELQRRLKERCYSCGKPIDPAWKLCPFCEAETGAVPPPSARRRRRGGPRRSRPSGRGTSAFAAAITRLRKESMDRTLILVKPDAFARNLTGEIIARFERKGLRIVALKHMTIDTELAEQHYAEHEGKPFFGELVAFITSGPLVAMVLEGHEAVNAARQVIGATNPLEAVAGLDPRRLRRRGRPEHGPRLGLGGVRRARGEPLLPRPLILASASPQRRAILEQAGSPSRSGSRRRGGDARRPARGGGGERAPQGAGGGRGRRRARAGADTVVALDGEILGKPRGCRRRPRFLRGSRAVPTTWSAGSRSPATASSRARSSVTEVGVAPSTARRSTGTSGRGNGRAGWRLRHPGPRSSANRRDPGGLSQRRRVPAGAALGLRPDLHPATS